MNPSSFDIKQKISLIKKNKKERKKLTKLRNFYILFLSIPGENIRWWVMGVPLKTDHLQNVRYEAWVKYRREDAMSQGARSYLMLPYLSPSATPFLISSPTFILFLFFSLLYHPSHLLGILQRDSYPMRDVITFRWKKLCLRDDEMLYPHLFVIPKF